MHQSLFLTLVLLSLKRLHNHVKEPSQVVRDFHVARWSYLANRTDQFLVRAFDIPRV
jgi:hypothetical protein